MRRAIVVLSAVGGLLMLATSAALASLGSSGPEAAPCLRRHHLPAFTAYDLGPSFHGLARTNVSRSCYAPPRTPHVRLIGGPRSVTWTSDATYGTCTPEGFEGGCGPPLDIQSWPECDRNFSSYGRAESPQALRPSTSFALSGSHKIPAAQFERGLTNRIEMYTGQTTIVIFAQGPTAKLALRAAHALAHVVAPKVSSLSAASLRAAAVSTRGCGRG